MCCELSEPKPKRRIDNRCTRSTSVEQQFWYYVRLISPVLSKTFNPNKLFALADDVRDFGSNDANDKDTIVPVPDQSFDSPPIISSDRIVGG